MRPRDLPRHQLLGLCGSDADLLRARLGLQPGLGADAVGAYGVDADRDGDTDVNDPADAIFTAARVLREAKGAPPAGGSYEAYRQAACNYYGACGDAYANYADQVMARASSTASAARARPSRPIPAALSRFPPDRAAAARRAPSPVAPGSAKPSASTNRGAWRRCLRR